MKWKDEKYTGREITKELLIEVEHDIKAAIDHYAERSVDSRLEAFHNGNEIIVVAYNEETANYLRKISGKKSNAFSFDDYVCTIETASEGKVMPAKVVGIRRLRCSGNDIFMYEVEFEGEHYNFSESELASVIEGIEIAKGYLKERLDFLENNYFDDGKWVGIPRMEE